MSRFAEASPSGIGLGPVLSVVPSRVEETATPDATVVTSQSLTTSSVVVPMSEPGTLPYKTLSKTIQITNTGTKPLTQFVAAYQTTSDQSASLSTTCPSTLPVGASCTLTVSAYRHLKADYTGNITLTGSPISPITIPVSLRITDAPTANMNKVVSDSIAYNFGSVTVGQASSPKTITFTYTGDKSATLTIPASNSKVQVLSNTCTAALTPAANSCAVQVTLTPSEPRTKISGWSPSYRLGTAGSDVPLLHSFSVTGLGEQFNITSPLSFGVSPTDTPSVRSLQITNTGNRPSTFVLNHTPSTAWSVSQGTPSCATVEPNTTCVVPMTATSSTEALHSGSLLVTGLTSGSTIPTSFNVTNAPKLQLSAAEINFGQVFYQASVSPQSLKLFNTGATPATLGFSAGLNTVSPVELAHNCPDPLPAYSSCDLTFSVNTSNPPQTGFPLAQKLMLAPNQPYASEINIRGTYFASTANSLLDAVISPPTLVFPYTPVGQQSLPQRFSIWNGSATDPLTLATALNGVDASQFTLSADTCAQPIAPKSSCSGQVTYNPSQALASPQATQLNATSASNSGILTTVLTAATAKVAALDFAPVNYDPSNTPSNTSIKKYFYTNTSNATAQITPAFANGTRFELSGNTCASVASGATCSVIVKAKSDQVGMFQDTLNINGEIVNLSSTVYPFSVLQFSQQGAPLSVLDFGTVSHRQPLTTPTVELSNLSATQADLNPITFVSLSGVKQANNCPLSLTAGNPCQFDISATPSTLSPLTMDSYNWQSTLSVSTKDGTAQVALPIKGTSVVGTHHITPSVNFGNLFLTGQPVSKTATLTNTSTNSASIALTKLPGTSNIATSAPCLTSPATFLAPGQSCDITLTYTPSEAGTFSGTLNAATTSKSGTPSSISWTATVLAAFNTDGVLAPSSWTPSIFVGQPQSNLVTFTNTYSAPLTIGAILSSPSSSFTPGLSKSADTCTGQTIQPGATCTFTVAYTASQPQTWTNSSTFNVPLSPVNQTVSFTVPQATAVMGPPAITSTRSTAIATSGYSKLGETFTLTGSGFSTNSAYTKVFVNGTQLTTTARTADPYKGWTASLVSPSQINIGVSSTSATATAGTSHTVEVVNTNVAQTATTPLTLVQGAGKLAYSYSGYSPSANNTPPYVIGSYGIDAYPLAGETTQHTSTITNVGGTPMAISMPTWTYHASATVSSNSCAQKTSLDPLESCSISLTHPTPTTNLGNRLSLATTAAGASPSFDFRIYPSTWKIIHGTPSTNASSYMPPTQTATLVDWGTVPPTLGTRTTSVALSIDADAKIFISPAISGSPAFSMTHNCAAEDTSCTATITFDPTKASGPQTATLVSKAHRTSGTTNVDTYSTTSTTFTANINDNAPTSAGIDLTGLVHYFPLSGPEVSSTTAYTALDIYDSPVSMGLDRKNNHLDQPVVYYANSSPFGVGTKTASIRKVGYTLYYGGFVTSSTQTPLSGTGDFSISFWSQNSSSYSSQGGTLVAQVAANSTALQNYASWRVRESNHKLCFEIGKNGTPSYPVTSICTTTDDLHDGTWKLFTITRTSGTISLYRNGNLDAAKPQAATYDLSPNVYTSLFYEFSGAPDRGTQDATLTDLAFFNRALTPSEIQQMFTSRAPLKAR